MSGRLFDGQNVEDRDDLMTFMNRCERECESLLQNIERDNECGELNVMRSGRKDPRLGLLNAIEGNAQTLDRRLNDKICADMSTQDAWCVVEFLKSQRGFIDDTQNYMLQDKSNAAVIQGVRRRYLAVEEEILRKVVTPLSQMPHEGFLQEMRSRHLPFDMNAKLGNLFEYHAFVREAPERRL